MPVRSTALGVVAPAAAVWTTLYTVPAGETALVKSALVYNAGGAGDTVYIRILHGGALQALLFAAAPLAAGARLEWDGWVAAVPGDLIQAFSLAGLSHFWVSGAVLPGVA